MAVYYKFKSAKDYDSITIDGHFISVINLKERIFESKRLGRGTDFDLIVTNAQTNEEYLDEAMLIPINTSVLIRRVPGLPRMPIVILPAKSKVETKVEDDQLAKSNFMTADSSFEASDFDDEFGDDIYVTIPEVTTRKSNILMQDSTPPNESDEDSKIKALIESSGFEWQSQAADGFVQGRDFVRGGGGGRGFGRGCGLPQKTPPRGYICHRCNIPGHYIQHCPTNGDPNFDIRKVKPTTGIPKSMVEPAPDGLYVLPSGASAVLKPNEAAFGKEVEGISSSRSMVDLPPELHCPLCNEVMKDAVCTSKCCFKSFCDKCIRDYIISKSMCFCEAKNILADDILPNKTVRDTINRILESGNSRADNVSSSVHVQDSESARCLPPKIPSPTQSAASNREQKLPSNVNDSLNVKEKPDVLKVTHKSARVNEHVSQSGALPVEEAQQKLAAGDTGKKKRKKMSLPPNGADMQGMAMQPGMDGYAGPSNFYPHLQGMQSQINGYMGPFVGNMPYNMGYNLDPIAVPWANVMPPELVEPQNFIYPPQRYLAVQVGVGMNVRSPLLNREEFEAEARRPVVRRNGEMERQFEKRELPGDHGFREHSSNATKVLSMKSKPKPLDCYEIHRERDGGHDHLQKRERSSLDHHWEQDRYHDSHDHHRWSSHSHGSNSASQERLDKDTPRSSLKRKEEHHELEHDYDSSQEHARVQEHDRESQHHDHRHRSKSDAAQAELDRKQKAGVLSSRISFPKEEPPKKPKLNHHTTTALPSLAAAMDYESSYDDERHLKRKPLRYEPSPLPREKWLGADEEAWMWRHSHKIKC